MVVVRLSKQIHEFRHKFPTSDLGTVHSKSVQGNISGRSTEMEIQMNRMRTGSSTLTTFTSLSDISDRLKNLEIRSNRSYKCGWKELEYYNIKINISETNLLSMELPSEPDDLQVEEREARSEGAADATKDGAGNYGLSNGSAV